MERKHLAHGKDEQAVRGDHLQKLPIPFWDSILRQSLRRQQERKLSVFYRNQQEFTTLKQYVRYTTQKISTLAHIAVRRGALKNILMGKKNTGA